MTDESSKGVDFSTFLKAAGQSLSDAQGELTTGLALPTAMALSNAELEVKVAVSSDKQGRMSIQPISARDVRRGGIEPGVLSTLRISFVGTVGEATRPAVTPAGPKRNAREIIGEVRKNPEIAKLEKVLGRLNIQPSYVPEKERWLVSIYDPEGRMTRELTVPDIKEERKVGR